MVANQSYTGSGRRLLIGRRLTLMDSPASRLSLQAGDQAVSVRDPHYRSSASAGGYSALPSLSRDGRFVAFVSSAQNLAPRRERSGPGCVARDRSVAQSW
jgi:hypothetical protein